MLLSLVAAWTDLRSRRIPNWLTVPGLLIGVGANTALSGWSGLKASLLGAAVGLALLLPFVLLRSLGAGDWKLAGALGAFTGPSLLVNLLLLSVLVAGVMAVGLVIYKRRTRQTIRNIGHILVSLVTFRLPGSRVSLDDPESLKVPYGVALAFTVVLYGVAQVWGVNLLSGSTSGRSVPSPDLRPPPRPTRRVETARLIGACEQVASRLSAPVLLQCAEA